jgi:hypothetical protein
MNVYDLIFHGTTTVADKRSAIVRAVRQLRESMEREDNSAVTAAHVRTLCDLEPATLARAYADAERLCTFWPTPGQIRELAGWSIESEGREALQWVFQYLELHGIQGRPRGGGIRFEEDAQGRRVMAKRTPEVAAPQIPEAIDRTLAAMGSGARQHGLRALSQHPRIKGWDNFLGDSGVRTAERIEAQWLRCFLQTQRKQPHPGIGRTV